MKTNKLLSFINTPTNLQSTSRPNYKFKIVMCGTSRVLCVEDCYTESEPTVTVTNSLALVMMEIGSQIGILPTLIIYKDTDQNYDRILLDRDHPKPRIVPIVVGVGERITNEVEAIQLIVTIAETSATGFGRA